MEGLFCEDILVTSEIFLNETVPRYALYNKEGLVQMCLFLVPGTIGYDLVSKIEGIITVPYSTLLGTLFLIKYVNHVL